MRAVVTGATGFTGGALAQRLVALGHDVLALVRASSDTRNLQAAAIETRVVDLNDACAVRAALEPGDTVFHIAAAYRAEHADEAEFVAVNVDATRVLLEAALARGARRFVHCSTVGVQGAIEAPPASEDYRTAPNDHYQASKLEGERLALTYCERGLDVTVVRPVGIYGPGDTRFLKLFRGVSKGWFLMIGDGETLYHLTYIDDLIDGFLRASEHPAAVGEVFTVCGARYTTLNELVGLVAQSLDRRPPRLKVPAAPVLLAAHVCDWICKRLGLASPLYPRRVEFFLLDRAFTHAKASTLLDYRPRVDLEEGLARTRDWYRDEGLL
ncbi:MAG: NAD-dependent epimerase/dehydratase family protein [Pseudomonadota bacterium]